MQPEKNAMTEYEKLQLELLGAILQGIHVALTKHDSLDERAPVREWQTLCDQVFTRLNETLKK